MVVTLEKEGKAVFWKSVRIDNKLGATDGAASLFGGTLKAWEPIHFFVRLNHDFPTGTILKVYGWNPGHSQFWIDDISADLKRIAK
jgi:hypothetical protein